jgi:hypothetical protein
MPTNPTPAQSAAAQANGRAGGRPRRVGSVRGLRRLKRAAERRGRASVLQNVITLERIRDGLIAGTTVGDRRAAAVELLNRFGFPPMTQTQVFSETELPSKLFDLRLPAEREAEEAAPSPPAAPSGNGSTPVGHA